jgi:hypothetical protein
MADKFFTSSEAPAARPVQLIRTLHAGLLLLAIAGMLVLV